MKDWAVVVAALYGMILVVLTVPVMLLAFAPQATVKDMVPSYLAWPYWVWLGVMVLGQVALLAVPVKVASRRPVARRSLLWPVVTAGLMMGGLAVGAMYSLREFAARDKAFEGWFWWAGDTGGCGDLVCLGGVVLSLQPCERASGRGVKAVPVDAQRQHS